MRAALLPLLLLGCAARARAAGFNDVVPGPRAQGMGMAYTALSDDPYGMFYNPAGLAGSDFAQLGGGIGRAITGAGNISYTSLTYARPLPLLPGSTLGAAYLGLTQQRGLAQKDAMLFHFSHAIRLPQFYITRPVQVGGNVRFVNVESPNGKKFGLGLDAGAILDSGRGLRFGVSVTELTSALGVRNPSLNTGVAYRLRDRLTLAADMRVRPGLTQLFPGLEADLYQKLLKLRLGKGLPLHGVSTVALGVGANFSPVIIDFAAAVPFKGFNRDGGGFQVSLNYKFGAPPFYGRFVGTAARQAEDLRSEIEGLDARRLALQRQVSTAEAEKEGLDGQVRALGDRLRELQGRLRELEAQRERAEYEEAHRERPPEPKPAPPPKPKPKPAQRQPKAPDFPRYHTVAPGDTLRSIAERHYGDADLWEQVYEANRDKVERGLPVEGVVLRIPAPRAR